MGAGTLSDQLRSAFEKAAQALDPSVPANPEFDDPYLWAQNNLILKDEDSIKTYQAQVMRNLAKYFRESVRGPHGLGKTAIAAIIILWFADTREKAGIDWKVVTTASVFRQLDKYLWPEVHKWARRMKRRFTSDQLFQMKLKLTYGEAFAVASDDHEAIEGAHADHILYIYDEAKAIPPDTYDATEGAFAGAAKGKGRTRAYALAISTPGEAVGRFHDIQTRKPGYEDWHVTQVTLAEAIAAGRISPEWAAQRLLQWGEGSAVYQNRVLGEFAANSSDGVIPSLAWIEAAQERWRNIVGAETLAEAMGSDDGFAGFPGPLTCVTADVARQGTDKTIIADRYTAFVSELQEHYQEDTMTTAGRIAARLGEKQPGRYATVDVIGIGAGVVDKLRMDGYEVLAFNASEGTTLTDSSGELTFANKRSAAWWNLRELLDPSNGFEIALPPDEELLGDLLSPTWKVMVGGRIQVERKDEIRKRLGRSPDRGDTVVMSFWDIENEEDTDERLEFDERVAISNY